MSKFINGFFEVIGTILFIVLLPFILLYRLIVLLIVLAVPVLIVASPFILIGFIAWLIFMGVTK